MASVLDERTKELCILNDMTPERLAEILGVSVSSIRKWQTNVPSVERVRAVAEYFNVSIDYLVGLSEIAMTAERLIDDQEFINMLREEDGHDRRSVLRFSQFSADSLRIAKRWSNLDGNGKYTVNAVLQAEEHRMHNPVEDKKRRIIPMFGNSFAAGVGEPDFGNALEEYEVEEDVVADFAVRVNGKSMEPYLHDGQVAFGVKGTPKVGDIVAIMVDGAFYVKQFVNDNYGNLYLLSLNREYPDVSVMASSNSTVRCFGVIQMGRQIPVAL